MRKGCAATLFSSFWRSRFNVSFAIILRLIERLQRAGRSDGQKTSSTCAPDRPGGSGIFKASIQNEDVKSHHYRDTNCDQVFHFVLLIFLENRNVGGGVVSSGEGNPGRDGPIDRT